MKLLDKIITQLFSARFIVVILLTLAFCYMSINNTISTEFTTIFIVVINYYFYKDRNISKS